MTTTLIRIVPVMLLALVLPGGAAAEETKLRGIVGPGASITLLDATGARVTQVPAGAAEIEIDDRSDEHNFHLVGPGVDKATTVDGIGSTTFKVTFVDGKYDFFCDPHPLTMKGAFTVGQVAPDPTPTPAPTPTPTAKPSAAVGARLLLTSGPGFAISLKTTAGRTVKLLRPGAYTVVARDRSTAHNARLRGAGANKATAVGRVGTQTWKVTLRKGTLVFQCDPHRGSMRGTVAIR